MEQRCLSRSHPRQVTSLMTMELVTVHTACSPDILYLANSGPGKGGTSYLRLPYLPRLAWAGALQPPYKAIIHFGYFSIQFCITGSLAAWLGRIPPSICMMADHSKEECALHSYRAVPVGTRRDGGQQSQGGRDHGEGHAMRGTKEAAHTRHAGSSMYARIAQGSTGRSTGPMRESVQNLARPPPYARNVVEYSDWFIFEKSTVSKEVICCLKAASYRSHSCPPTSPGLPDHHRLVRSSTYIIV